MTATTERDDSFAPGFLVAAPRLEDSPFEKAVILMVHHDEQGSMGFIINKPIEMDFGSLIESANETIAPDIAEGAFQRDVYFGGPVRVEQLWVIYRSLQSRPPSAQASLEDFQEVAELPFHDRWVLAGDGSVIESFAAGRRQETFRPVIGYAGWGPGQLEAEIEEGSWLAIDFDADLLVDTAPASCWETALKTVGLDPATFMMMGKGGRA